VNESEFNALKQTLTGPSLMQKSYLEKFLPHPESQLQVVKLLEQASSGGALPW
jgi:hypothetical protein